MIFIEIEMVKNSDDYKNNIYSKWLIELLMFSFALKRNLGPFPKIKRKELSWPSC